MNFKLGTLLAGMTFVAMAALVGCGSNNNNATAAGSCGAGQVNTQYGCVAQAQAGQCPTNATYGWYNNQCVQTTAYNGVGAGVGGVCTAGQLQTQFGCQPIAQAGQCPVNGQQYAFYQGQCVVGTATTGYNNGYNGGYTGGTNQCGPGAVMTQYNCLPQGQCPVNYGFMNGACYPAIQNGYNPYGGSGTGGGFYWGVGVGGGYNSCPYGYYYYNGYCVR